MLQASRREDLWWALEWSVWGRLWEGGGWGEGSLDRLDSEGLWWAGVWRHCGSYSTPPPLPSPHLLSFEASLVIGQKMTFLKISSSLWVLLNPSFPYTSGWLLKYFFLKSPCDSHLQWLFGGHFKRKNRKTSCQFWKTRKKKKVKTEFWRLWMLVITGCLLSYSWME